MVTHYVEEVQLIKVNVCFNNREIKTDCIFKILEKLFPIRTFCMKSLHIHEAALEVAAKTKHILAIIKCFNNQKMCVGGIQSSKQIYYRDLTKKKHGLLCSNVSH